MNTYCISGEYVLILSSFVKSGLVGGQQNVNVIDTSGVSGMTPIVRKKKKSTTGKGKQQDVSAAGGIHLY